MNRTLVYMIIQQLKRDSFIWKIILMRPFEQNKCGYFRYYFEEQKKRQKRKNISLLEQR